MLPIMVYEQCYALMAPQHALCTRSLAGCAQHVEDRYPVGVLHKDPAGASDSQRRRRFAFHTKYRVKKTHKWKRMLPQLVHEDPQLDSSSGSRRAQQSRS